LPDLPLIELERPGAVVDVFNFIDRRPPLRWPRSFAKVESHAVA
jgi:hypothetical protein